MKKAYLVTANVTTRVVVDVKVGRDNPEDYDKIIQNAKERLIHNLSNDYLDQIEDVREDKDVPYNPINDDVDNIIYECPECGEKLTQGDWGYNYDTAKLDFVCPECGWVGTDNEIIMKFNS